MSGRKRKQVIGQPTAFKGEFSFVNKDASNINSKDHNAAVSWHVMNRFEKWKKSEHTRKLRKGTTTSSRATSAEASASGVSEQKGRDPGLIQRQRDDEIGTANYPPEPWHVDNAEQSMLDQTDLSTIPPFSMANQPQMTFDPQLTTTNLEATANSFGQNQQFPPIVSRILSYAYGVLIPTTWPCQGGRTKWTYEIAQTWDEIAAINSDACYASATLCLYATLMASALNDRELASQACFFQTQAMTELRQRVTDHSGPYDSATLQAMLRLFSAETALDNTSTARVHLKMLRNVVSAEGGVILLDSWFRENLLSADCYFALKYQTRPVFPASEWTPGSLSQPWKLRISTARTPNEHSPNVDESIDNVVLRSIIADIRELFRVEQYVDSFDIAPDDQLLRWRQLRKYDCISRLAEHQLSVKIYPHLYDRPKLQLAVCIGVALMTGMVLGSPEPIRFGKKLLTDLTAAFAEAKQEIDKDPASEGLVDNVVYWLLYVGQLAERAYGEPATVWFGPRQERMVRTRDLDENDQEDVVKQLLYSAQLQNDLKGIRGRRNSEPRKGVYEACGISWRQPDTPVDFEAMEG